jgi:hypothetical protein
MQLFIAPYQGNRFLRLLRSMFVNAPLSVWFGYITAYWPTSATFINYTAVADEVLAQCWQQAQQQLATQPFPLDGAGTTGMHPADPRALTVAAQHLTVVPVPDVSPTDLATATGLAAWLKVPQPSGTILVEENNGLLGYITAHAVTETWRKPRVYAAASQIPTVLIYEFQNIILHKLGYNVEGR